MAKDEDFLKPYRHIWREFLKRVTVAYKKRSFLKGHSL
jgi:hypothetical protein